MKIGHLFLAEKSKYIVFLFFCLFILVGNIAHAQYATGGSSPYRDQVLWLTWGGGTNGTSGQALNVGASSGATIQVAGSSILDVSCSITDITHSGGGDTQLNSYRPGDWQGDVLDDLYNIGGTGGSNQLINGISRDSGVSDFTIECTATLDGQPFRLNGLVMADAEAINTNSEYVEATAEGTWNVVEMAQNPGAGSYTAQKTNNGDGTQTIRFGPGTDNETAAVTFLSFTNPSDNVGMDFSVDGGGVTAIAIGLLTPYGDFGDAPGSYGDAMHLVQDLRFQDDNLPADGNQYDLNDPGYEPGGLAPSEIDYIGGQGPDTELEQQYDTDAEGDDNYPTSGSIEEDAWPDNYTITVLQEGETLSETIPCTGDGTVAGWIDFDRNGTFDNATERTESTCSGGSANLSWTIPSDLTAGISYVRLRYSTNSADIANPTGTASDGEVEDHVMTITAPDLSVTKSSNATGNIWEVGEQNAQYSLTVTNNGPVGTGDPSNGIPTESVTVRDELPTGIQPSWSGTHTSNGWDCTFSGQEVTCTTDQLIAASGQSGDQSIIQLPVQITEDAIGQTTNYASVAGGRDPFNGGNTPDPGPSCSDADHCAEYTVTVEQAPELTVEKELANAPSPIVEGSELEYTITATNSGNVTLSNVEISDPQLTPDTEPCGTLDIGDDCTLTGSYTVTSSDVDAGEVVNTATATGEDPSGGSVEDDDELTTPVPLADLAVSKTVDNPTPNVGEDITFTVSVTNNGTAEATNVSITDQLPSGYSFQEATAIQGSYSNSSGVWNIGTLANGATVTMDITATVLASGNYQNTASVSGVDQEDPDPNNDEDTSEPNPSASADVEVTKTLNTDGPFTVDQEIEYTLVVGNNGPSEATNIAVTDTPTNLDITTVSGSGCSSFPCTIPSLADGSTTTISVTGTVQQEGAFGNTATAEADEEDPNPGNNSDDDGDTADPSADIAVLKTVSNSNPSVGDDITFTIEARNNGPSDATNVSISDALPAGYSFISAAPSQGNYDSGSGLWSIGSIANGATATLDVMATVDPSGPYANTASVNNSEEEDPDPNNDEDTSEPTPSASVDISLTKTLNTDGPFIAGQEVEYTITIGNNGPSEATNIAVTDTPTNLDITTVSGSGCSSFPCTIPSLADGSTTTISVTGTVQQEGAFGNTATAEADEEDSNPDNNTDNDGDSGNASADVAITKVLDTSAPYSAGQEVAYTLTLSNNGPSEATGILVEETPTNLTIIGVSGSGCSSFPCTVANLAEGSQTTISVTATIDEAGNFDNKVTATPTENDPNEDNNTSNDGGSSEPSANISVDKTLDTEGPFSAGQEVQYTLTVSNAGPSDAQNVEIVESSTNLTITEVSGADCNNFPCTIPTVADGDQQMITVSATIDEEGSFQNGVTVTSDTEDPDPNNNEDDDPENGGEAGTSAEVSVDKTLDTEGPYVAGQEINYTLTVSNAGPSEATGIEVTDSPENLTITEVSGSGCSSFPCTIETLEAEEEASISVTATIDEEGDFTNVATIETDTPDRDPNNNEDDDPENGGEADAPIEATDDDYGSMPGGADHPDSGTVFNNDEKDGGPINPPETTLEFLDELPEGMSVDSETGQLSISSEAQPGEYTFDYQICAVDNPNNCDTATVTLVIEAPSADVSLDKTLDTEGPYLAGQEVNYTLTVSNAGPSEATDVMVEEDPTNLMITNVTGSGCSSFPCTLGTLAAGGEATITVTATIQEAGTFDNTASANGAEDDPSLDNNNDEVSATAAAPELQITKQAQNLTARPGSFVPYTITIDNLSDVPVTGVQLVDTPAPGLSYVEQSLGVADTDNAGLVEGLRPLRVGQIDVPAGGQAIISYVMRVGATALPGELHNVAYASWNGNPISSEDEASVILEGDPIMDDTRILGTVFRDHDRDGWQDKATATDLYAQGGFDSDAYVPGSTTIDRGTGPETIPDGSAPLLNGLDLGDLGGRKSVAAEPAEIVIRQRLRSPDLTGDFRLTSDEGSKIQMSASGEVSRDPQGAIRRGANSQRLIVDRSLQELDNGQYQLSYRISNTGYDDWGLPGTRLATPRGLIIETDGYGRYHIEAIEVDSWRRGHNYVVKVDGTSLPRNSTYTTENPLVRRVTQGLPVRFDFGVWWPSADVSVTKTLVADSSYHPAQQLTYRLTVANDGPTLAEDIRLNDKANNLTITDVRGADCDSLPCLIPGPLASGEQQTLIVKAQIDTAGAFTNTATAWATQPDPVPANNKDRVNEVATQETLTPPTPTPPAPCEGAELLPKAVHFETDKAILVPASAQMLDQLAVFLEDRQECLLQVAGHTDHDLDHDYNQDLSDRRAEAIVAYLKAAGVPEQRMSYTGLSYDNPAVKETDVLDKAQNRRTSFSLQPEDSTAKLLTQIEDLQVDPEPRAWDYVFDFRHNTVPTRLHFPDNTAELNFVSEYLLKRISLALAEYPDVTVRFAIPVSADADLKKRRIESLQQALATAGLATDRYRITEAEQPTGPVRLSYTPNDDLVLVGQADDIRLAGDQRYQPLLKKALQLLEDRRDAPLLNSDQTDRLEMPPPKGIHLQPKSEDISHKVKAVLTRLARYLQNHPEQAVRIQGSESLAVQQQQIRQYLLDRGTPTRKVTISTAAGLADYLQFVLEESSDF